MRDQPICGRRRERQEQAFTLVELMIVVVIIGVLSAIAIPTFSSYVYKSRTSEATEFLGVIKLREESYRSEYGAYCPTNTLTDLANPYSYLSNPVYGKNPGTFVGTTS